MATFNRTNQFSEDLGKGVHILGTHQLKVALTNTAPTAANATYAALTSPLATTNHQSPVSHAAWKTVQAYWELEATVDGLKRENEAMSVKLAELEGEAKSLRCKLAESERRRAKQ